MMKERVYKGGRKRACTPEMQADIHKWYAPGIVGYKTIARLLEDKYKVMVHWTTVRLVIKGRGTYGR